MSGSAFDIVVIGRSGQLAWELQRLLPDLGRVIVVGRPEIDLTGPNSVRRIIRELHPDVLVNAGAYTAVDQAEGEPERAFAVNAEAPQLMAEEAKKIDALFVTYSTDYVFDGGKGAPYTELDVANPLSVYGTSKLAGDLAVEAVGGEYLIFRTSWVYATRGKNFLLTMMRLALERDEIRVVDDQTGAPTLSRDIAQATRLVIGQLAREGRRLEPLGQRRGIYNMTAQGSVSWCGFAMAILEDMRCRGVNEGNLARIVPISTAEYPTAATRPRNSRLSNEKICQVFGVTLPDWKTSLTAAMKEVELGGRIITSRTVGKATDVNP